MLLKYAAIRETRNKLRRYLAQIPFWVEQLRKKLKNFLAPSVKIFGGRSGQNFCLGENK